MPLCQPMTASLTPTPDPAYQSMNEDSARTSPAIQVTRSPAAQRPLGAGRGYPPGAGDGVAGCSSSKKSGVSTCLSMGNNPVGSLGTGHAGGLMAIDEARQAGSAEGDFVAFVTTGAPASGAFRCSACGYGVSVYATLPPTRDVSVSGRSSWNCIASYHVFTRSSLTNACA